MARDSLAVPHRLDAADVLRHGRGVHVSQGPGADADVARDQDRGQARQADSRGRGADARLPRLRVVAVVPERTAAAADAVRGAAGEGGPVFATLGAVHALAAGLAPAP